MELRTDFIDTSKIDTSKNWNEWSEAYAHNGKIKRINTGIMLEAFGKFLLDRGFTHILVSYEGAGDSGECYYAEGFKDDEYTEALRNTRYGTIGEHLGQYHTESKIDEGKHRQKEVRELFDTYKSLNPEWKPARDMDGIDYVLTELISYDWYNNEGGQGDVIWDLHRNKVTVEGYQNYRGEYECKEEYFLDGRDPKQKYKDIR
tara:strand:+ start:2603 stop:3211 length:609 start_codon:yes stop_codon:yes gene_type:complete